MTSITLALTLATAGATALPADAQQAYTDILATHVKNGRVDYRAIAARDLDKLDRYLAAVAKAKAPQDRNDRIGFYVDAYNALVLRSVIQHGRPRSVLDVKGFFKDRAHTVAGRKLSLDELEKKVLNPFAKDPRTHFVLVCGAVGCPIIESKPFFGDDLDRRMDRATRRYLASPFGARVEPNQLKLSKIFDWYAEDFGGRDGVRAFVLEHLGDAAAKRAGPNPKIGFIDYNWTLNQQ